MRILKKSLALLLAFTMIASLVVVNVVATDPVATISLVPKSSVLANGQVEIDIVVANNPGMIQNKLFMNYNTDVFDFESYTHNADLAGALEISANSWLPGKPGWEEGYITLVYGSGLLVEDNTVSGTIGTLTFTIKGGTAVGNYDIAFNARTATDQSNAALADVPFTYVGGVVNVTEENWIASTGVVELGDIKYGADAPALPATVKGIGKTSGGTAINAADEPGVVLNVEWGTINTLVAPADGLSVAGTVTTTESDLLKYKNADGEPIAAPAASATYDIVKTDAGVVAPVEIEIKKKSDGSAIGLEAIKVLEEVVAVANTTIAIEGGETETVTLNWAGATLYDDGDATLDTSLDAEESIQLNVPVTGDTTYYDLTSKVAVATLTMVPAEIEDAAVTIEGATTADDYVKVAVALPEEALGFTTVDEAKVYNGTFTLAIDAGAEVLEDTHTYSKDYIVGTDVDVTVEDGVATLELIADTKLSAISGINTAVDAPFTVSVYYNNAALVVDVVEEVNILGVTGKIMAVGDNTTVGGIGIPTTPAKPMTPVTPDEPGTEEPGTEEPGTEEPGTEEPGTDAPAIDTPIEGAPFGDITEEYRWAVDSIATLKDLGVINGNENGDFVPAGEITRAEFTKMMVVLLGLEITEEAPAFADCAADAWFAPYIAAAAKAGIINGVSETEFAPDATITREQACAILGRALGLTDAEVEATFTDAGEISDYAESFVAALAKLGIINGYEDGSFAPANNITRAEAAKILAGALGVIAPTDAPAAE